MADAGALLAIEAIFAPRSVRTRLAARRTLSRLAGLHRAGAHTRLCDARAVGITRAAAVSCGRGLARPALNRPGARPALGRCRRAAAATADASMAGRAEERAGRAACARRARQAHALADVTVAAPVHARLDRCVRWVGGRVRVWRVRCALRGHSVGARLIAALGASFDEVLVDAEERCAPSRRGNHRSGARRSCSSPIHRVSCLERARCARSASSNRPSPVGMPHSSRRGRAGASPIWTRPTGHGSTRSRCAMPGCIRVNRCGAEMS